MTKLFTLIAILLISFASHAQECATTVAELKILMGNNGLPLNWAENTKKDPLTLRLSNGAGALRLKLTSPKGDWADVTGVICKKGMDSYVAKVNNIVWGPAAPNMVKAAKIKEFKIKMPYQTQLKVSVSFFSFEFSPL